MADDPRLSVKARLDAKGAAWQKQHCNTAAQQHITTTTGSVGSRTAQWQQKLDTHEQSQAENPFSAGWKGVADTSPRRDDDAYGRPKEGTKTEYRGKQAGVHISGEIVELCDVIQSIGVTQQDGTVAVTFGLLFETYTRISNKLVGMLMRARKQNLVRFEGEMLFQRRDDDKIIWLVNTPEALMVDIERRKQQLNDHDQHTQMKK